jgi:hypothetical protein
MKGHHGDWVEQALWCSFALGGRYVGPVVFTHMGRWLWLVCV